MRKVRPAREGARSTGAATGAPGGSGSGGPGGSWFEEAGFWERFAPVMFGEKRWAEVPEVVDAVLALSGCPAGGAVLDAACGPGRHSVELALRGYRVTGVDLTPSFLEAARESAEDEGVEVEWVREDLRRFLRPRAFDLALNLFTSFGYCDEREEDLLVLRNIRESLKPGGALIIETIGKETAVRDFTESEWYDRDGWTVLADYEVVGPWRGLRNRWVLYRGTERYERSFVQRLYAGTEMEALLLEAGFSEAAVYGSLEGAPYDLDAGSLVALARA